MYSPKIKEALIPRLYAEAKRRGVPMTTVVNSMMETWLKDMEQELLPEVHDWRIKDGRCTATVHAGSTGRHTRSAPGTRRRRTKPAGIYQTPLGRGLGRSA
jgi:hypothetical protein